MQVVPLSATAPLPVLDIVLYLAAAALAAFSAASELIGRFRDAPYRAVFSRPGSIYLLLNGALAVIVLGGLRFADPPRTAMSALEQLLLAGFGARLVLRTKVVSARGKEGTEETGPGAVFERLLSTISRSTDRSLAADRLKYVSTHLSKMEWLAVRDFFPAELGGAMQDLTQQEKQQIRTAREIIETEAEFDDITRIHLLGYMVLEFGGKEFLEQLVALYWERFPSKPGPSP